MVDLETVQKMWSNSGAPGNYAFSSHLIYPQIAWVQWNGGQEDGAMAIFFIKALWVRSSLKVPMVIQVFKDIPGKLGVLWVTVNLPLTTEPHNTGIKKEVGINAQGGDGGTFKPWNPTVTHHLQFCPGYFIFHVNDFCASNFETRKSTWMQIEIQMENCHRNEDSLGSSFNLSFTCPSYLGHIIVLYIPVSFL